MRVVICGAEGQLGRELVELFERDGDEVLGFDLDLDITEYGRVMKEVPGLEPDLLVNAAADTDLDGAEVNPEPSYRVNYTGSQNLALACQEARCPMAFISTDYVFDGMKGDSYNEFDLPNPQGVYAKAKLAAEQCISSLLPRYYIFRTQWLFGRYGKRNFIKSILRKARERETLRVVTDEVGTPTGAGDLAEIVRMVSKSGKYGLYHATNSGKCSRYDFARDILKLGGYEDVMVEPVTYEDLDLPCPRPPYSPLDNANLRLQGFPPARHYMEALREYIEWLKDREEI